MVQNQAQSLHVETHHHENGIYETIILTSSRTAVDGLFDLMEIATLATPPHGTTLFLIDGSKAGLNPPLNYAFQRSNEFMRRIPVRPKTRTVVIYTSSFLISLLNAFLTALPGHNTSANPVRFFKTDEREAAIAWLLEGKV